LRTGETLITARCGQTFTDCAFSVLSAPESLKKGRHNGDPEGENGMRFSKVVLIGGIAAGALALASGVALASHGKVGLWSVTVSFSGDIPNMPDISKMPPQVQAEMKKMGMSMSNHGMTAQHCMTAKEVAQDMPPSNPHEKCKPANVKISGHSMSMELVCDSPDMKGTGHASFTYDTDTHYTGQMTMNGVAHGHQINQQEKFEGHWISASCGNITH
jgi:hypothetical protein